MKKRIESNKKELKKNTYIYIYILIIITILRFFISCNLPSFYINNLSYDDQLMIKQSNDLMKGNYLGEYSHYTLIKDIFFPVIITIIKIMKLNYSTVFTVLYILASLYFVLSLKNIIKNKTYLLIIYILVLFNPISFSSELFQRLYRNSLTIIETLFFLGTIIRVIWEKKNYIANNTLLGIIMSIMFLTREDNIWTIIILFIVVIYKIYKKEKIRKIIINGIPLVILLISLNTISFINYKNYGIFTYNELKKSNFKNAYIKILQIKDDEKKDKISIPKSTLYKLCDNSKVFNLDRKIIDRCYRVLSDTDSEIYNGNFIWLFRNWVYTTGGFKDGKEAEDYFGKLDKEIEELFDKNVLEEEFIIPSIFINMPTVAELKEYPKDVIEIIKFTTTYANIKTFKEIEENEEIKFDRSNSAYSIRYLDYHNTDSIIKNNVSPYEEIRVIYKYYTIVFTIISMIIYIKNIIIKDRLNLFGHIILICYLIILLGVSYTEATAFPGKRYFYLGNVYILQNIFILINLVRFFDNIKKRKNSKSEGNI